MSRTIRSRSFRPAAKATISIRLTRGQRLQLEKACKLHRVSQSGYLTHLAVEGTRQDLVQHAVRTYQEGRASVSELAQATGIDVPTILDAVALNAARGEEVVQAFLKEAQAFAKSHKDPGFYELAKAAVNAETC